MKIQRRDFLKLASAGPLIFGLQDVLAGTPAAQDPPAWWKKALERMKELERPGLVFITPEGDDAEGFGFAMRDLLESEDSLAQEIFCSAVVVCLRPDVARICLGDDAAAGKTLVLDATGRIIERVDGSAAALRTPAAFEERHARLIHGSGDRRLRETAESIRLKLTAAEKAAFDDLTAEAAESRERAVGTLSLAKNVEALLPLIVFERRTSKDPERALRLRQIIDLRFKAADEKKPGPRLPFGTYHEPGRGGCGAEMEEGTSLQCGMGRLEGKGQRFLRFLNR